ncbi:hypothetical protein [Aestuariispira ectoiniformans]|uniref:hypothetical protein n=1 Tax=Aestuariispira ectoiniformans TaxID=2775080 RepID=UPI00223B973E|nr:hypothetical protein [Aestuariispira ectoiniformans]
MSDISRDELKAHLSAVEAQVRAALRIVAAESKSVQQAHGSLRADLSSALVRLQSDMTSGHQDLDNKLNKLISDVQSLERNRKITSGFLAALVLIAGIAIGMVAGGSWVVMQSLPTGPETHQGMSDAS